MKKVSFLSILFFSLTTLQAQWVKLPAFTNYDLTACDFVTNKIGVVVGNNGAVYKTNDGGNNWQYISPEKGIDYTSVEVNSVDTIYVSGCKSSTSGLGVTKLYATFDSGNNWLLINNSSVTAEKIMVKSNNKSLYFLTAWRGLQKSNDNGLNWNRIWNGGGTTVLSNLKFDNKKAESLFGFGNYSGYSTYSSIFRHLTKEGKWHNSWVLDFGNDAAYTSFNVLNDTVLLFQNNYSRWMPTETNNRFIMLYNFIESESAVGAGDTVWHFSNKVINNSISHYVQDCHFFSNTGLGFSVDLTGRINKTLNGGTNWTTIYNGSDTLNCMSMLSDTIGYVVGNKGTILKMSKTPTGTKDLPEDVISDFIVYPSPAKDKITIETSNQMNRSTIKLVNLTGQIIFREKMTSGSKEIDINNLTKGIYFVILESNTKIGTKKIVKE